MHDGALQGPARIEAHYALWEACQACGDRDAALAYLDLAVRAAPLRTRRLSGARPLRSLLRLAAPGDFQANLPIEMLLDGSTLLHTLFLGDPDAILSDPGPFASSLRSVDSVLVGIAEDGRHERHLAAADVLAKRIGRPVINDGARIARLTRDGSAELLADTPGAIVPRPHRMTRTSLASGLHPPFPFLLRPLESHAGRALALILSASDLRDYLAAAGANRAAFFATPFVETRSADGLYRKYRVVFVAGEPFPVHMAVHDGWGVWYYNAGMERHPGRRAEEARFLADMDGALGAVAAAALRVIGAVVGLDYFGLDCGLAPDGRIVVFEVETGMIVHDRDPVDVFPYKREAIGRVRRAFERLIDRGASPRDATVDRST